MRFVWLLASVACALVTALFCYTLVYYFMHYSPTLRVLALISVVVFWIMLTQSAFAKFRGQAPR
jgi:uncharacterized RDD family membrane protein YckC